jgi:PTS system nitrogen regulatory IIA component
MQIGDLLDVDAIIPQVNAPSKRQALALVADVAARRFGLKAPEVLEALLEREQLGSTGVGHGVGVPHARLNGLERMRGVFVRLETPIDFKAVDEQPVDLLFALFAPADAGAEHLRALARVSRILRRPALREQLRQSQTADALFALLVQEQETSAA